MTINWSSIKEDKRPQRGWWAPGDYICFCTLCRKTFIGDKRAGWCADCAYGRDVILDEKGYLSPES